MSALVNDRYEYVPGMSMMAEAQFKRDVAWIEAEVIFDDDIERRLIGKMLSAKNDPSNQWRAQIALQARDNLVEAYQPIVLSLAQKSCRHIPGLELMDVVSEANIGLLTIIEEYVSRAHARNPQGSFKGLAIKGMSNAIWSAHYMHSGLFSVPSRQANLLSRLRRASTRFLREHGYEASVSDLAALLDMSEQEVCDLQEIVYRRSARSLQGLISEEKDMSDKMVFSPAFCNQVVNESSRATPFRQALHHVIKNNLTPIQREVITYFYSSSDETMANVLDGVVSDASASRYRLNHRYKKDALGCLRRYLSTWIDDPGKSIPLPEETYSSKEVAALLGISPATVIRHAADGLLPVVQAPVVASNVRGIRYSKCVIDAMVIDKNSDDLAA